MWTKDDNNTLRQLIKNGTSVKDIVSIIGRDKMLEHPDHKYVSEVNRFFHYSRCNTKFEYIIQSVLKSNELDYTIKFKLENGKYYTIIFTYLENNTFNVDLINFETSFDKDIYKEDNIHNEVFAKIFYLSNHIISTILLDYNNIVLITNNNMLEDIFNVCLNKRFTKDNNKFIYNTTDVSNEWILNKI